MMTSGGRNGLNRQYRISLAYQLRAICRVIGPAVGYSSTPRRIKPTTG